MRFISSARKILVVVAMAALAVPLLAAVEGESKVTGKVFTHWYYDLTDDSTITKHSAFDLTRAYLGGKYAFNDKLSGSITLDVERLNELTDLTYAIDTVRLKDTLTGTDSVVAFKFVPKLTRKTKTNELYEVFLKTAFLEWKGLLPLTTLSFGVIGGIGFGVQEKFWGYRYIYKSYMDQYKYAHSADLGLSAKVKLSDMFAINAAVTQGEGYKKPQDTYGLYQTGLGLEIAPIKGLLAYLYGDIMPSQTPGTDSASIVTVATFVGYELKDLCKVGVEYVMQGNRGGFDSCDVSGVSAYAAYSILKQLEIFARLDLAQSTDDWNLSGDGMGGIGGVHYSPVKNVKAALNLQTFKSAAVNATRQTKLFLSTEFGF